MFVLRGSLATPMGSLSFPRHPIYSHPWKQTSTKPKKYKTTQTSAIRKNRDTSTDRKPKTETQSNGAPMRAAHLK